MGLKNCLVLCGLLLAHPAYSQTTHVMDKRIDQLMGKASHQRYHQFLLMLQRAVQQQDKSKVASLISYPITAPVQGKDSVITDPQQFIKHYEHIFTPALRSVVLTQRYQTLFANSEGVMIGKQGEIWYSGICQDSRCQRYTIKIIRINNPQS